MITIITGKPGVGKTALNTYFCWLTYQNEREQLLKRACDKIEFLNESREKPLQAPTAPPIFTNYEVKFLVGYQKYYEPYYVNPYYLGLANEKLKTQFIPPFSRLFISEAQRYYNSRKSSTLPDWVSRWYEMHRHYGVEVYMDVQRGKLIDLNIRELCKKFIEVQSMELDTSGGSWIQKTRWHCREFSNMQDYDEYINGEGNNYTETTYEYDGDIFENYNSTSCFNEFVPAEGADFHYLPYRRADEQNDEATAAFYNTIEPELYRKPDKATPKPKEQKGNAN
ncbi:MAG: hypothetical protein K2K60_01250 [Clostridia bacterium]|nr:hypothetical protein [Clostridia bacterium]